MYKMLIKITESDISKERILLRYHKICRNTEKGLTNVNNIKLIDNNGEIIREYERNTQPTKHI